MSNRGQNERYVTPCGRWQNAKGEPYSYQHYLNHIDSCPKCQKIIEAERRRMTRPLSEQSVK